VVSYPHIQPLHRAAAAPNTGDRQVNVIDRVVAFVKSHPGFYVDHTAEHVVIAINWSDRDGNRGTDYETASTIQAARDILGY
jgi:hypothetical protein